MFFFKAWSICMCVVFSLGNDEQSDHLLDSTSIDRLRIMVNATRGSVWTCWSCFFCQWDGILWAVIDWLDGNRLNINQSIKNENEWFGGEIRNWFMFFSINCVNMSNKSFSLGIFNHQTKRFISLKRQEESLSFQWWSTRSIHLFDKREGHVRQKFAFTNFELSLSLTFIYIIEYMKRYAWWFDFFVFFVLLSIICVWLKMMDRSSFELVHLR